MYKLHPKSIVIDEDLDSLTAIQRTFIVKDAKFIYFRKGEAVNDVLIIAEIIGFTYLIYQMVKDYPEFVKGARAIKTDAQAAILQLLEETKVAAKYLKEHISKSKPAMTNIPDIKKIACPDHEEITTSLEILRDTVGDVRYLPKERRGKFRYFLNDKQFCLFIRRNNGRFNGFLGKDPNIISALKEAFETEWSELTPVQDKILPTILGMHEAREWYK